MGTWGTAIKDNDSFADIYSEFFELYNKGEQPDIISKKIVANNWEILEIEEEKNSLWFALALSQWETKSLDPKVLSTVEDIISSGAELKIWLDLGASEQDIEKRKIALNKFLEKIRSDRPKAKPRKKAKLKTPVFSTGDCLVFKLANGNYGGAVVLATDNNPESADNLIATTRLNQINKPTIKDFENSEVLITNYGSLINDPHVGWYSPTRFLKEFSNIYQPVGKITVELKYSSHNVDGKGYLFKPFYTAVWVMNHSVEMQLKTEMMNSKPSRTLTIRQLTKKKKWWNFF